MTMPTRGGVSANDGRDGLDEARSATRKLLAYCRANDWAGYDPYDALNSALLTAVPLLDARMPRILLTQALKRSPVNVRRLALVPRTQHAKAIALFLSAIVRMEGLDLGEDDLVTPMVNRLVSLRSPSSASWCWGYSFPWQTRTVIVPRGAANLVCTTFAANALLDAYERCGDSRCLDMAVSAAQYVLEELYWTDGPRVAAFGYPLPSQRTPIHNANFLGAALLARVGKIARVDTFADAALAVARYSAAAQREDGSWPYGEASTQQWIDNFHTGYNLCALRTLAHDLDTSEFDPCIGRGFVFYRTHFVREDGAARYFHDRTYPIDVHAVAQTIITLLAFRDVDAANVPLAQTVFRWTMQNMWDERGFFYYRRLRLGAIRTSYIRWSQAWMLLALATLLTESTVDDAFAAETLAAWV